MRHTPRQLARRARRALHRPHRHLRRRWDWYARWHDHPIRPHVHGGITVGALFVSGALLANATTGLQSTIKPSTPTVQPPPERPADPPGQARDSARDGRTPAPEPVRRSCGDRVIVTDTVGTADAPVRFRNPDKRGRWVLTLSVVRRSAALGPIEESGRGSTVAAFRVRDEDIDCPDVRRLAPDLPVAVDLSQVRVEPDCERCSLDGVRPYAGSAELEDHDELVLATGDERSYGQWALSGIRVSQTVPTAPSGPPADSDKDTWVVLTLASI